MTISNDITMVKSTTGRLALTYFGKDIIVDLEELARDRGQTLADLLSNFYARIRNTSSANRETVFMSTLNETDGNVLTTYLKEILGLSSTESTATPVDTRTPEEKIEGVIQKLMDFFSEFSFEPNFRFVNTVWHLAQTSMNRAKDYIICYFSLMDNQYLNELTPKLKSREFEQLLRDMTTLGAPTHKVNNRFKVYYGSAGTGKTTLAMKETDNRCVVCNNAMLPSDIMEDFVFAEGKPTFKKSMVWECMEKGLPIVLDEINLLPFDSLRFLQGILDGKSEFDYKGNIVKIAEGFKIIGTMNLAIGGMVYGLPEPLVDRTEDIQKFTLSAKSLMGAVL